MLLVVTRSQPRCVYCEMAKNLLSKSKLEWKEVPITDEILNQLQSMGIRSLPAVFISTFDKDSYLGGHTELQRYVYNH